MAGTELAISGTANGVAPQLRNDYNKRDDWLFSAGLNNEFKISDQLSLLTDLSYSRNKRVETVTETYAGFGCCVTAANQNANRVFDSISWDISGNGFPQYGTGLDYADASQVSLGDRAPWGGWGHDGLFKQPHVKEQVYAADAGLRYQPMGSVIEAVDVGANFTRRDKKKRVDELDLMLKNGRLQTLVDPSDLVDPTSLGFAGLGGVISVDLPNALDRYYDFVVLEDANHFDKAWRIKEDVTTFKVRMQFASGDLHGNMGFQVVHQKQESTGSRINFIDTPATITEVTEGASYWDFLPSLNAYYDIGGGHRIRFAASKVLAQAAHGRNARKPDAGLQQQRLRRKPAVRARPNRQSMVGERRQPGPAAVAGLGGRPQLRMVSRAGELHRGRGFLQEARQLHLHAGDAVRLQRLPASVHRVEHPAWRDHQPDRHGHHARTTGRAATSRASRSAVRWSSIALPRCSMVSG